MPGFPTSLISNDADDNNDDDDDDDVRLENVDNSFPEIIEKAAVLNGNADPATDIVHVSLTEKNSQPTTTTTTTQLSEIRNPAPDGGWGWVVVFSAMFITTIVGGSFTGFSLLYIEFVEAFETTRSVAAWVGSVSMGCGNIMGIFFSSAVRQYGSRIVCMSGAVVTAFGYLISSVATSIVHLYLSVGLISGVGVSMMAVSSMVIVQQYFNERRAIAGAVAVSGFSLGSLIAGPIVQLLLDMFTWRGTLIVVGGIFLQVAVLGSLFRPLHPVRGLCRRRRSRKSIVVKSFDEETSTSIDRESGGNRTNNKDSRPVARLRRSLERFRSGVLSIFGFSLLSDAPFLFYILSIFFVHAGVTTFFQHTPSRAVYFGVDRHMAALLPTISGTSTGIFRLVFGFVANIPSVNRTAQYSISAVVSGIIQATTVFATTFPTFALFSVMQGISNGGFFCILTTILVDLKGVENIARSQALLGLASGVGVLVSAPFAGFLFDATGNYDVPFIVTGCLLIFGGILGQIVVGIRCVKQSKQKHDKC